MTSRNQKLELTWIGKENRLHLEPHMLLEDAENSCPTAGNVNDQGMDEESRRLLPRHTYGS